MRLLRPFLALALLSGLILISQAAAPKKEEPRKPLTDAQKQDYVKVIQPIFDARCASCHGAKKVKGKLRLDSLEATLKGGKNPTFTIGKPNDSMLLARVFLERTAGDVMPPKSEKPLTQEEKEAIYTFVEGQPISAELAAKALGGAKAAK